MTLRDLLNARATTAAAVSADQAKIVTDTAAVTQAQGLVVADNSQLATDQAADAKAVAAIAAGITSEPGNPGYSVDVQNPNADGTYNLYVLTSATTYNVLAIPSVDATLPGS